MQFRMIHNGADRDSMLYRLDEQHLDLALRYRIELVRVEPTTRVQVPGDPNTFANGDGQIHDDDGVHKLAKWEEWEWFAFRDNFPKVIKDFWDEKFELTPNRAWFRPSPNQGLTAPKVTCSLDIELVAGGAHQRYFIINLAPNEQPFRSFAVPTERTGVFTQYDLSPDKFHRKTSIRHGRRTEQHRVTYFQTTILHEFGHTMGLHHVRGQSNKDDAYGITLDERTNMMGFGEQIHASQASPWISQMRRHLISSAKDQAVNFKARVIAPQQVSHFYFD